MGCHIIGNLDGPFRRRFHPRLGYGRAAFIAGAAIVGRKRRFDHKHFGRCIGKQMPLSDQLRSASGTLPFQRQIGFPGRRLALVILDDAQGAAEEL